ncbi:unnamed protein product [Effrenium voratum]|nr:unnamed protein product [Effrenium voratum]
MGDRSLLALKKLGDAASPADVRQILEPVLEEWRQSPRLATAVLSGLARGHLPGLAARLLRAMEAAALRTDVIHYNSVLTSAQWRQALQLLQNAQQRWLRLQSLSCRLGISACRGAWSQAVALLYQFSQLADVKSCSAAMSACEAAGEWQAALALLEGTKGQVALDVVCFGSLISACEKGRRWELAIHALTWMDDFRLSPDQICLNAAVSACQKAAMWQQALDVLRSLPERRLQRDAVGFNSALGALKWSQALRMARHMMEESIEATVVTFNSLMGVCEWQVTLQLLVEMPRTKLAPNNISFRQLLRSLSSAAQWQRGLRMLEAQAWPHALQLLQGMPQPDLVSFNSAISSCRRVGDLPLHLLLELRAADLRPDAVTFSACVGDWRCASLVLREMSQQMLEAGAPSHNAAISAFEKAGEWPSALSLLGDMKARRFCDTISFNSAISASAEWPSALAVLQSMTKSALLPDAVSYGAAISACEKASCWPWALWLLGAMEQEDVVACSAAISALEKASRWAEAVDLLAAMADRQVPPNDISFNSAISACANEGCWQQAWWLLHCMTTRWLERSIISFSAAISACEGKALWRHGIFLVQAMLVAKCTPDVIALNSALGVCEAARQWRPAVALLASAAAWALQPEVMSCNMVLGACAKSLRWQSALGLLEEFEMWRLKPSIVSFNTVLSALDQCQLPWQYALGVLQLAFFALAVAREHPHADMALEAKSMSYDDLNEVVEGLTCRPINAVYTPEQPRGIFNITTFPMRDLSANDNPASQLTARSLTIDCAASVRKASLAGAQVNFAIALPAWAIGCCDALPIQGNHFGRRLGVAEDPYVHLTNRAVQKRDGAAKGPLEEDEAHIWLLPSFLRWAQEELKDVPGGAGRQTFEAAPEKENLKLLVLRDSK